MEYYSAKKRNQLLETTRVGEDVENREASCSADGCSHSGKPYGVLKKLKIELLYDTVIPLLGSTQRK